nr:hypothetical protein [Bacteroides nordii]
MGDVPVYRNRPGCLGPGGELGRVRRQRNGKERNGKRREADAGRGR